MTILALTALQWTELGAIATVVAALIALWDLLYSLRSERRRRPDADPLAVPDPDGRPAGVNAPRRTSGSEGPEGASAGRGWRRPGWSPWTRGLWKTALMPLPAVSLLGAAGYLGMDAVLRATT